MNDAQQGWFNAVITLLVTVVAFMLNIYRRKVDKLESQHIKLVTREELQRHMDQIRDDRLRMHDENIERLKDIAADIRAVHIRVDQVFSNGKNGNGGK
jgi:hypothetical protein